MKDVTTACTTFNDFILYGCNDGSCYSLTKNDLNHNQILTKIKTEDNDSVLQIEFNRPCLYILCCNNLYIYEQKRYITFEQTSRISVCMSSYNNMIRHDNYFIIACSRIPEKYKKTKKTKTIGRNQVTDGCFVIVNLETNGHESFLNPHELILNVPEGVKIFRNKRLETDVVKNLGAPMCVTKFFPSDIIHDHGTFFLSGGEEGKIKLWNISKSRNKISIKEADTFFDFKKSVLSIFFHEDQTIFCVTRHLELSILKKSSGNKWLVHKELEFFQFTDTFSSFYTLLRFHDCETGLLMYGSLMKKKKTMSFIKMIRKQSNSDYDLVNILLDTNKINSIEVVDSKLLVSIAKVNNNIDKNLIHESVYEKSVMRINNCPDHLYYLDNKYLYKDDSKEQQLVDAIENLSPSNRNPSLNEVRMQSIIRYYRGHEFFDNDNIPPYLIEYLQQLIVY